MSMIPIRTIALLTAISLVMHGHLAFADKPLDYNRDVRPILSENCFYCHGPDPEHREADLRFDEEESAKDYAIVPGDLESSEFYQRIIADADTRMPPVESGKKLSAKDIATLKRWIEQGAQYDKHWAYVPPKSHPVPDVQHKDWPKSDIDRFLLAKIETEGLKPSPEADKVTLLRRVTFDLTGLPPTVEELQAYQNDQSPDAFEKVVDRLLASDRFGERMAIYWLDLVRFADTVGYHGDQDHNISPYRDYVLDAFNANLPFDQFTREQLAGDLLPDSTVDQKIASGYNRLLQTTHEGGLQEKEYLAIYAADRVRNVSQVWMGATVGCAQCHTHKYDPYTIDDFYRLAAFFADVDEAQHFKVGTNALPTKRPPEIKVLSQRERVKLAELQTVLAEVPSDNQAESQRLQKQIDELNKSARLTMITQSIKPRPMRVLPRGNWLDESGVIVTPAIPTFLGNIDATQDRATRLDLANWLTDPQHGSGGLTARVFANRLWYLFYGVGLSASLGDFGGQGEPPVHPELLDYLAIDFYQNGWDVKRLVKTMIMTSAYQQSSFASEATREQDPYNRFYSHQTRHRLPAEMIRDNALAVSGLLNLEYGGPSVKPYQPAGYYRHLNFPQRKYQEDKNQQQWRRGVYVHWQRQFLHPSLKAFDAPSREECTVERARSNTPLAALALLNDPTYIEAAREFATRILSSEAADDNVRLNRAYMLALSREPDSNEKEVLGQILNENREIYRQDTDSAAKLLEIGLKPSDDAIEVAELAAWTQVARVIFNLDEFITRN
ncbi:hypothetical protein C5Y96_10185 [Blastopirellula marina]|uniref:Cytochrome c domain-containing protein n=1 Tax=Blastopirellula marina TaxID=124 RepID=A0A2S8FM21_9BACT|nr:MULTISPECIES: PSD1 and planctomycete cytochrome C domain-containing protein [Pirellulaceae]PQO33215.1 hypothetical protein C5Y96_10185 [Blastopirellula marina]RCS52304.1 DUF1553 domain-containing protein [Bremerella cremea]